MNEFGSEFRVPSSGFRVPGYVFQAELFNPRLGNCKFIAKGVDRPGTASPIWTEISPSSI